METNRTGAGDHIINIYKHTKGDAEVYNSLTYLLTHISRLESAMDSINQVVDFNTWSYYDFTGQKESN